MGANGKDKDSDETGGWNKNDDGDDEETWQSSEIFVNVLSSELCIGDVHLWIPNPTLQT